MNYFVPYVASSAIFLYSKVNDHQHHRVINYVKSKTSYWHDNQLQRSFVRSSNFWNLQKIQNINHQCTFLRKPHTKMKFLAMPFSIPVNESFTIEPKFVRLFSRCCIVLVVKNVWVVVTHSNSQQVVPGFQSIEHSSVHTSYKFQYLHEFWTHTHFWIQVRHVFSFQFYHSFHAWYYLVSHIVNFLTNISFPADPETSLHVISTE